MKTVSVIIPVHNAEAYLEECIRSVLEQTYQQIELIVIDDASDDLSRQICIKCREEDERMIFLQNDSCQGVSKTRNKGLDICSGEYVVFLDADDYLDRDILRKAVACIEHGNCDICQWNFSLKYNGSCRCSSPIVEKRMSYDEIVKGLISTGEFSQYVGKMFRAVWGKCLKRELCGRFEESLFIGEDSLFLLDYVYRLDQIKLDCINEYGYFYRMHEDSAVHKPKDNLYEQLVIYYDAVISMGFAEKKGVNIATSISNYLWEALWSLILNDVKFKRVYGLKKEDAYKFYVKFEKELHSDNINLRYLSRWNRLCYYMSKFMNARYVLFMEETCFRIVRKIKHALTCRAENFRQ